jgi:hypothetical protein
VFAKPSLSLMAQHCPNIPSQRPNTEIYVPVSCLQQSGTDRYAEVEACSTKPKHKGMLGKYVGEGKFNNDQTSKDT